MVRRSAAMPRRSTTGPAQQKRPQPVRVAVVHSRPMELRHIRQEVEQMPGYRVVLAVARGKDLLKALDRTEVDLVLVSVAEGEPASLSTLAIVRDNWPGIGLIALADSPEVPLTALAYCAGAKGVLDLLDTEPDALRAAVVEVGDGHFHLNAVMDRMMRARGRQRPTKGSDAPVKLTECETTILCWMGDDSILTERGIAEKVQRKASTVHTHIKHIYAKLGAHSWREALRRAVQYGLLPG